MKTKKLLIFNDQKMSITMVNNKDNYSEEMGEAVEVDLIPGEHSIEIWDEMFYNKEEYFTIKNNYIKE